VVIQFPATKTERYFTFSARDVWGIIWLRNKCNGIAIWTRALSVAFIYLHKLCQDGRFPFLLQLWLDPFDYGSIDPHVALVIRAYNFESMLPQTLKAVKIRIPTRITKPVATLRQGKCLVQY
jgi:hypothetical protein